MKRTLKLLCVVWILVSSSILSNAKDPEIKIVTSNKKLEQAFNWAKVKARSYVLTGKSGAINASERSKGDGTVAYMPSYWAGYPHRSAFYSRDYCHQMSGAHLLGLQRENYTMLRSFASTANESRKWYPLWAINFDGSNYTLDYRNDNSFVREVPAVFELVEKAYKQFLWTGNMALINDPVIWNYCTNAVTKFIDFHDNIIPNGIAEGDGSGSIFKGVATYNEDHELSYVEAADGISCQYQALLTYGKMLAIKGGIAESEKFLKRANQLKQTFNNEWSINSDQVFSRGRSKDGAYLKGFGRETSFFVLLKQIADNGEKSEKYADFIAKSLNVEYQDPVNIESITYLPDLFFPYNRVEDGWKWTKTIISRLNDKHVVEEAGLNSDYPEVSYTLISNIVENLMGVEPNAPMHGLATIPRLPADVAVLGVSNIPMGDHLVSVLHEGNKKTTVTHAKGRCDLTCELRFYGRHSQIVVNGKKQVAKISHLNGVEVSSVVVKIGVGKKVCARV